MRNFVIVTAALMLSLTMAYGATAVDPSSESIPSEDVWLAGVDFEGGEGQDVVVGEAGVTMAPETVTAAYLSDVITAPIPYNALVPQWEATVPEEHALEFEFRTGRGDEWGDWTDLHESPDMTLPGDAMATGNLLMVPGPDVTHDRVQFRVTFTRAPGAAAPRLERLRLTFMDSTAGPSTAELVARQKAQPDSEQPAEDFPKPFVVSREVWCDDETYSECNYSDGLEYHPVSHLILHHTVTSSDGDSAETVRAIWKFHTFDRGWGDIGYNYLVDVDGVIFEGHLGGDDVVGTHAGGANQGTMALSMIGNFVDVTPPQPMFDAAADLFAWKADQKDIDIYDAGYLPDVNWGLPKLMGHRDVYGTTQCPGERAHDMLPALREAVAQRLGFTPQHLYYDEHDPQTNFTRSGGWTQSDGNYRSCGFNSNAYVSWSTTDENEDVAWAQWRPEVPVPGYYRLYVYAPYCYTQARDTNGAVYRVTDPFGVSNVTVNQEDHLGAWVSIGDYWFEDADTTVRLTNLTSTDDDWGVWADAVRLLYLEPGAFNREPLDASWLTTREVTFRWTVTPDSLASQRLQVATDPFFTNLVLDQGLDVSVRSYTHTFNEDYPTLYWRVRATDTRGDTFASATTGLGVDTVQPTSSAYGVLRFPDGRLMVVWRGEDASSGVVGYNIERRAEGTASWTVWQTETQETNAYFTPPQAGTKYWFRSQAMDAAGHLEPAHDGSGDVNTDQIKDLDERVLFPLFVR